MKSKKAPSIQELKNSIQGMEEIVNDKEVPESIKESIRPSIAEAKRLLGEAEKGAASKSKVQKDLSKFKVKKAHGILEKASVAIKEFNKGRSKTQLKNDAKRRAKAPGKRISDTGKTYYEDRPNRSDINRTGKPYLKKGGPVSCDELSNSIKDMEDIVNDDSVEESIKASIRPSIAKAKQLLQETKAIGTKAQAAEKKVEHKKDELLPKHRGAASHLVSQARDLVTSIKGKVKTFNKGRTKTELENDASRRAKAPGKRISDTGKTYYEDRANRSDINRKGHPYLREGGVIDEEAMKEDTVKSATQIATQAREKGISAKHLTFQEFAYELFDKTGLSYPVYKVRLAYEVMKKNDMEEGGEVGNIDVYVMEEYERGGEFEYAKGGTVPGYWNEGENINVFGYQTKYFVNSKTAGEEFKRAVHLNDLPDSEIGNESAYHATVRANLRTLAQYVDEFLQMEKIYFTQNVPDKTSYNLLAALLVSIGVYNYKSGFEVKTDFLGEHLYNISKLGTRTLEEGGAVGNGYIAFYKGKNIEVYADSSYAAQKKAALIFKAKKSYDVTVVLAEKDGKQVTHVPSFADGGIIPYDMANEILATRPETSEEYKAAATYMAGINAIAKEANDKGMDGDEEYWFNTDIVDVEKAFLASLPPDDRAKIINEYESGGELKKSLILKK